MNRLRLLPIVALLWIAHHKPSLAQNPTKDMVRFGGGRVQIGDDAGSDNEKPSFQTDIRSFWLDREPVTVAQFRLFVKVNAYYTDAEKRGESSIWVDSTQSWHTLKGASWKYPLGYDYPAARPGEPVRHISWNDAKAYAAWIGKRLPNEFEMEYALSPTNADRISNLDGQLWQWCENWYARYDEPSYYNRNLNREKTLKGGKLAPQAPFRASARWSAPVTMGAYQFGLRCAKD